MTLAEGLIVVVGRELPRQASLFVLLVTETFQNAGWIHYEDEDGVAHWQPEESILFVLDSLVMEQIKRFRQNYLFVLSCGGNYATMNERPEFLDWIKKDVFKNMIGFLNPRLSLRQIPGFLSRFVQLICVQAKPTHVAIVEAYVRDELTRTHSDIIWFTPTGILVYRHAPARSKPRGVDLPWVRKVCACNRETNGVKRWNPGREHKEQGGTEVVLNFTTSCCKRRLRLVFPDGCPPISEFAGVKFVKAAWPGKPRYYIELAKAPGTNHGGP
ncbi:hypothetical protein FRC06_007033 [Ceratobasidium sp. 370]|nr:hypothetical protein FRC06_007033 [Ceratobasidium sp. 370]